MTNNDNTPELTGTDNEILTQALRNLWPILSDAGRAQAITAAAGTGGDK